MFCNLRQSVKSLKKMHLSKTKLCHKHRFLRSTSRRILRAARKRVLRSIRADTHARFGNFASATGTERRDEAELSGKKRALDHSARPGCDWDAAPVPDTNVLFSRNCQYSLYPAYSEPFSPQNAINTFRMRHRHLFLTTETWKLT